MADMAKLLTIFGATGEQGGALVDSMLTPSTFAKPAAVTLQRNSGCESRCVYYPKQKTERCPNSASAARGVDLGRHSDTFIFIFLLLLRRAPFYLHQIIVTEVLFATEHGLVLGRLDLTGKGADCAASCRRSCRTSPVE